MLFNDTSAHFLVIQCPIEDIVKKMADLTEDQIFTPKNINNFIKALTKCSLPGREGVMSASTI